LAASAPRLKKVITDLDRFMVEVDRGTMPIVRADMRQTSFERKMRAYLAAHATSEHERRFGWKAFRVLTVTPGQQRARSMIEALRRLSVPDSPGPSLFWFATRAKLQVGNPLKHPWLDGTGIERRLT
jgi:hypothetical protein